MSDENYLKCIAFVERNHLLSEEIHNVQDGLMMLKMIYSMFYINKSHRPEMWERFWANYYSGLCQNYRDLERIRRIVNIDLTTPQSKWYFITVGYDDKIITPQKINELCSKVSNLKHWGSCKFVNERHRRDSKGAIYVHHHTHFLVQTQLSRSKVIQYVYQAVKKYVASESFVDVKPNPKEHNSSTYETYEKYINGDKQDAKLECISLDRKWRLENDIIQMN